MAEKTNGNNEIEIKKAEMEKMEKKEIEKWKKFFGKDLTNDEFMLLIEIAKRNDLDPFRGQVFALKSRNNPNEPARIFVSHAGLLHIAHRSGKFAGMKTMMITKDGRETLICEPNEIKGAVCYIWRSDCTEPVVAAVYYKEYAQPLKIWQTKPQTMIKKVAESHAIRRAFDLGGLYIAEEMSEIFIPENENVVKVEENTKQTTKQHTKKELSGNSNTLLALLKRIEEAEDRFGLKNIRKTLEKKLGKPIEQFSEPQLKQAINAVDRLEAKKIKESMYTDADFIEEEPAQPEEFQELGKPDDVDTIEQRLKEINEIFDD
jgi:phage recombination protein Bet